MKTFVALSVLGLLSQVSASEEHAHEGEHDWEWAGAFEKHHDDRRRLSVGHDEEVMTLLWTRPADSSWADESMKVLFLVADACSAAALEALEEEAETFFDADQYTNASHGSSITNGTFYKFNFDPLTAVSVMELDIDADYFVMFAEHEPMEFESANHFLLDGEGHNLEACVTEPEETSTSVGMTGSTLATTVFFASLVTAVCSLIGVLTIAPLIKKLILDNQRMLQGFSSGAILAAAFFLLLFEGNHMMYKVGDESEQSAVYGVSIISGILTGFAVKILTNRLVGGSHSDVRPADVEMATNVSSTQNGVSKGEDSKTKDEDSKIDESNVSLFDFSRAKPVAWVVFWGDMFHNISDGIVIGSAFLYCSKSFGWTITGATVAHEVTQELADWFILTGPGGFTKSQAVLMNLTSSLSAIVGAMIIAGIEDQANSTLVGIFLNYGGGVYLFIALAEIAPTMFMASDDMKSVLKQLLGFCVGVTALGLVLLNHEHCSIGGVEEGGDAHAH